ncbi:GNAT family N-acetyltransferase [Massilia antarctica]|uniref:GNAT family N-acetyltransferase n=1 Tax=Massilia antarctica TaxID=2765360 RepID=UPI0009EBBE1D|nr:GNAT family N-acetyltransferase [Massilia sp. H27-R4]MCY0915381.1 GNAT family N-acetyltransferase [Massilia sp. H27-R4]
MPMNLETHVFVPGPLIADAQRERMAALLFATSYLEYCSYGNRLRLPLVALQRRQNIDPFIAHSVGLFDASGQFNGFYTAATIAEFGQIKTVSYYRAEMHAMDAAYDAFIAAHARENDLFVASLALEERYRGRGLFNVMLDHVKALARGKGSPRIVLTVWENSAAMGMYLNKGFRSRAVFDYAAELFFDRLHFMELLPPGESQ